MASLIATGISTRQILERRRVTRPNKKDYFRAFRAVAEELLRSCPFAGDPYAFSSPPKGLPADAKAVAEYLQKVAVMLANRYPGDIHKVNATPPLGQQLESALIQRIKTDSGESLRLAENADRIEFPQTTVRETIERILAGDIMWEHMVGGKASRMKIDKEKFILTPGDLIERYKKYYAVEKENCAKAGKEFELPDPTTLPQPTDLGVEGGELFGVRHMLAFAYSIKQLAEKYGNGLSWEEALSRQTVFLIANEKILPQILELFKIFGHFGFDPGKVFFMATDNYNSLVLTEEGTFIERPAVDFIHNHGAARLETTEDNKWFTNAPGNPRKYSSREIEAIYAAHANLQSLNIEDLNYLIEAIDPYGLALSLYAPEIMGTGETYNMNQDVLAQQENRLQKGGVLNLDPDFLGPDEGRLVIFESFAGYPRFFHYIGQVADRLWRGIKYLNANMNKYPDPKVLFRLARDHGLPVWLDIKDGGFRNESPQGDANFFLRTLYIARAEEVAGEERPITITNMKVAVDTPPYTRFMHKQEQLEGILGVLSSLRSRGLLPTDYSFEQLCRFFIKDESSPADIKAVLAHPYLTQRLGVKHIETLHGLEEVFQVKGSHVYSVRTEGEKVFVKIPAGTVRGTARDYPSNAKEGEVEASQQTARIYREGRVWVGNKKDFSFIAVANQKGPAGEILLLLGEYDESVPSEKKVIFLKEKLSRVMEAFAGPDGYVSPEEKDRITDEFKQLPWQFLYENPASKIVRKISEMIGKPSTNPPRPE
jgi:hypothetical protein